MRRQRSSTESHRTRQQQYAIPQPQRSTIAHSHTRTEAIINSSQTSQHDTTINLQQQKHNAAQCHQEPVASSTAPHSPDTCCCRFVCVIRNNRSGRCRRLSHPTAYATIASPLSSLLSLSSSSSSPSLSTTFQPHSADLPALYDSTNMFAIHFLPTILGA